jgi:hypothetical protein
VMISDAFLKSKEALEPVVEERPVWQSGQWVVNRLTGPRFSVQLL